MNRFALGLLASTSLSGLVTAASASIVFENTVGFGASSTSPTIVPGGDTLYVGNSDLTTPAWFEIPTQSLPQSVQIQFTAARLGFDGLNVVPFDTLGEGSSLPMLPGTPGIIPGTAVGPAVTAQTGGFEGSSYPLAFQPVLNLTIPAVPGPEGEGSSAPITFAQVVPPGFAGYANGPEGASLSDSYVIDLTLPADEALPFSFTYDFDYTLDVTTNTIPEPATGTLLGLGLAGLAAARRRRRGGTL